MKTKQALIPQLRFDEYSGDFNFQSLGDHIDLTSGFAFKGEGFGRIGKKVITPKNFTKTGTALFTESNTKYSEEEVDGKFVCCPNDLLVLLTDLTPSCELLGKPVMLNNDDGEVLLKFKQSCNSLMNNFNCIEPFGRITRMTRHALNIEGVCHMSFMFKDRL